MAHLTVVFVRPFLGFRMEVSQNNRERHKVCNNHCVTLHPQGTTDPELFCFACCNGLTKVPHLCWTLPPPYNNPINMIFALWKVGCATHEYRLVTLHGGNQEDKRQEL